jgi:ubiquinone/menaquinone biosynthesis C-methylase UbiE
MTDAMLEKARKNQVLLELTHVEFRTGKMVRMPIADASVDVIISNCVINLSPGKDRVFREAHRVLRRGGRLIVADSATIAEWPSWRWIGRIVPAPGVVYYGKRRRVRGCGARSSSTPKAVL